MFRANAMVKLVKRNIRARTRAAAVKAVPILVRAVQICLLVAGSSKQTRGWPKGRSAASVHRSWSGATEITCLLSPRNQCQGAIHAFNLGTIHQEAIIQTTKESTEPRRQRQPNECRRRVVSRPARSRLRKTAEHPGEWGRTRYHTGGQGVGGKHPAQGG